MPDRPRVILVGGRVIHRPDAICICCGTNTITARGAAMRFAPKKFELVTALLVRSPGVVSYGNIHNHLYRDNDDGGPLDFPQVLHVMASQVRAQIAALGLRIGNRYGLGMALRPYAQFERVAA